MPEVIAERSVLHEHILRQLLSLARCVTPIQEPFKQRDRSVIFFV